MSLHSHPGRRLQPSQRLGAKNKKEINFWYLLFSGVVFRPSQSQDSFLSWKLNMENFKSVPADLLLRWGKNGKGRDEWHHPSFSSTVTSVRSRPYGPKLVILIASPLQLKLFKVREIKIYRFFLRFFWDYRSRWSLFLSEVYHQGAIFQWIKLSEKQAVQAHIFRIMIKTWKASCTQACFLLEVSQLSPSVEASWC